MRLLKTTLFTLLLACTASAGVGISINIGSAPYYGYAPPDVAYVQRYVPEYDMPRVFVIARYAHVHPTVVVDMYRRGYGWDGICSRYRVPVAAFDSYYGPRGRYYAPPPPPPRYYGGYSYAPRGNGFYDGRGYDRNYNRGYDRRYEKHWDKHYDRGRGHDRGRW
ncbi:hypothetical protein [Paludibaculum fermentans]|uniref:Uncharacterized protein n=1 Tax=Paludibaculum fermentans TaxID=1473598 RepID=A0A7S7NT07_PALFE|nr:hypothetical protein [Paludibaculum fermentans]QOY89205.1 hypothetical protein IRI77_04385 [Paludibaculum fermentans]